MHDTKINILQSIFEVENIEAKVKGFCEYLLLLNTMSKTSYTLGDELGISSFKAREIVKHLWPEKPSTNMKVCTYLLNRYGYKYCNNCHLVKDTEEFSSNKVKATGLNTHCKECYKNTTRDYQREYQKTRKLLKLSRVPSWANRDKIKKIYANCPEGYHVDHIIPLQGKLVSGFHTETNLQYLLAKDNLQKYNSFEVT